MSRKELLAVMLPVATVVVFAVVIFALLIAQAMSREQPEDEGEISNGMGVLGVPSQTQNGEGLEHGSTSQSPNGEELVVSESSDTNEERGDAVITEAVAITETDDFVLTISLEEATVSQGQHFTVNTELKNNSGEDYMIRNDFRFISLPVFGLELRREGVSAAPYDLRAFGAGSIIQRAPGVVNTLGLGTHELRFIAEFSFLDGETGEWELVNILSNPIALTSTDDFILAVSVEGTTLQRGGDFRVIAELKNNSGEDREISFNFLFMPQIEGWWPFGDAEIEPVEPMRKLLETSSVLRRERDWNIGYDLESGVHELRINATFWFQGDEQPTSFFSDPILLTVE